MGGKTGARFNLFHDFMDGLHYLNLKGYVTPKVVNTIFV